MYKESPPKQLSENRLNFVPAVVVGISVSLVILLVLYVFGRVASPAFAYILIAASVAAALLIPIAVYSQRKPSEKRKRSVDAYALIDLLVEELDDDEIAYLRRRLDARDAPLPDDAAVSIEDLLDTRAERRTYKR